VPRLLGFRSLESCPELKANLLSGTTYMSSVPGLGVKASERSS